MTLATFTPIDSKSVDIAHPKIHAYIERLSEMEIDIIKTKTAKLVGRLCQGMKVRLKYHSDFDHYVITGHSHHNKKRVHLANVTPHTVRMHGELKTKHHKVIQSPSDFIFLNDESHGVANANLHATMLCGLLSFAEFSGPNNLKPILVGPDFSQPGNVTFNVGHAVTSINLLNALQILDIR